MQAERGGVPLVREEGPNSGRGECSPHVPGEVLHP